MLKIIYTNESKNGSYVKVDLVMIENHYEYRKSVAQLNEKVADQNSKNKIVE